MVSRRDRCSRCSPVSRAASCLLSAAFLVLVMPATILKDRLTSCPSKRLPFVHMAPPGQREGYVMLVTEDHGRAYDLDAVQLTEVTIVALHTLRAAGAGRPIVVALSAVLEPRFGATFRSLGAHVRVMGPCPAALVDRSFPLLRLWEIDDFDRLVYLAPDVLVLRSPDALFGYAGHAPGLAAAKRLMTTDAFGAEDYVDAPWDGFHAAVLVLSPSRRLARDLIADVSLFPWLQFKGLGRQTAFLNWRFRDADRLPFRYAHSIYAAVWAPRNPRLVPEFVLNTTVAIHMSCRPWSSQCLSAKTDNRGTRANVKIENAVAEIHAAFWRHYDKQQLPRGGALGGAFTRGEMPTQPA